VDGGGPNRQRGSSGRARRGLERAAIKEVAVASGGSQRQSSTALRAWSRGVWLLGARSPRDEAQAVTRKAAPTHKLAALDPSCGTAVWPAGAALVDRDPWAREELLRGHLVLRLCDGVATRREEAGCGMG
jgi:hypothetical protein